MKVAIAGFGTDGQASYEYYRERDYVDEIVIYDERPDIKVPSGAKAILGDGALGKIPDDFMVIRTSGLAEDKIKSGGKIWTSTNEFFVKCPAKIIGVTGSKGKGTTVSFIAEILRAAGQKVHVLGNIGVPALSLLSDIKSDDIVVFELSSFQLMDAVYSPNVAVITNIEPDHLDVHKNMAEYIDAKSHIVKYQKPEDLVVFNQQDKVVKNMVHNCQGRLRPFPSARFAHIKQGSFYYKEQKICSTSVVRLPGRHNMMNALAAINATYNLVDGNKECIGAGLGKFTGLPHRLKLVRTVEGVSYYDDSIATTPGSATAAIKSFDGPKILILGGADKGADYNELAREILAHQVKAVVAIGANRKKIISALEKYLYSNIYEVDSHNMNDIVEMAEKLADSGDVVIMSPAAASFDMFKSYVDRGEKFITAVKKL